MAMEMYFTLVDDQESDVRMVADENLNRITRSLGDSSVGRLQVTRVYRALYCIALHCTALHCRWSCTRRSRRMGAAAA